MKSILLFITFLTVLLIACKEPKEQVDDLRYPIVGDYTCDLGYTLETISFLNDRKYRQSYFLQGKKKFSHIGYYSLTFINEKQGYSLNLKNYIVTDPNAVFQRNNLGDTINAAFFYNVYTDSSAVITRVFETKAYNLNLKKHSRNEL